MSSADFKHRVLAAAASALRPLARLLLASGIPYREFAEMSKRVFVQVATDEFGVSGRPTNVSRVALMTGLARREVRRLRASADTAEDAVQALAKTTDATRLLTAWHLRAEYLDPDGRPLPLAVHGPAPSFAALHEQCGGDVAWTTVLKDLQRAGAVEVIEDGRLRALTRYFMPMPLDATTVARAGDVLHTLGNTLTLNVTRPAGSEGRFEGRATVPLIPAADVPAFRAFLEQRGMAFLEDVDAWLTDRAAVRGRPAGEMVRLGAGVYQILEPATPIDSGLEATSKTAQEAPDDDPEND